MTKERVNRRLELEVDGCELEDRDPILVREGSEVMCRSWQGYVRGFKFGDDCAIDMVEGKAECTVYSACIHQADVKKGKVA